jgi:alpha-tubulin suppressor-like RCC1 family protein
VKVSGLTGVTAIAAGFKYSMALKSDGTVWTWGDNEYGQLGDGTKTARNIPVKVSGLTGVTAIAAGESYCLALKNDGTVRTWGNNSDGQLGDGTKTARTIPVQVSGLTGVTAIAGGDFHSLALRNDGTVRAWGWNILGQLGNGTFTSGSNIPVQVSGLNGVTAIAAGNFSHSLALRNDGTMWAWGYNRDGQLGNGSKNDSNIPVQVSELNGVKAIAGGYFYSLALKNDGTVWAFGNNNKGQLGTPYPQNSNVPVISQTALSFLTKISTPITTNAEFITICSLDNLTSFSGETFTITYTPSQVQLIDFAAQTPAANVNAGVVVETNLEIISHNTTTGVLTFKVNKTVASGKSWSGDEIGRAHV